MLRMLQVLPSSKGVHQHGLPAIPKLWINLGSKLGLTWLSSAHAMLGLA